MGEIDEYDKPYINKNFSEMFYPQHFDYYDVSRMCKDYVVKHKEAVNCANCLTTMKPTRVYSTKKMQASLSSDDYMCEKCLKLFGIGFADGSKKFLPTEVVMVIMCYLRDFRDFVSCARTCWQWFTAANYDKGDEGELLRCKRYLIGKEIAMQYHRDRNHEPTIRFESRLKVGALVGEWQDPQTGTKRKLALARLISLSPFYTKVYNLLSTDPNDVWKETPNSLTTKNIRVVSGSKASDPYMVYTYESKDGKTPLAPIELVLDAETGCVLEARKGTHKTPESAGSRCRCVIC